MQDSIQQSNHKKVVPESLGNISEQLTDLWIQLPQWLGDDLINITHKLRIQDTRKKEPK